MEHSAPIPSVAQIVDKINRETNKDQTTNECKTLDYVCGKESSNTVVQHFTPESASNIVRAIEEWNNAQRETASRLGSYITKEYELLHLVLSHLPVGDLNAASQVCRTWNSAAAAVRRSRINPHWILWRSGQRQQIPELPYRKKILNYSESMASVPYLAFHEYVYSEPVLALMFASLNVFGARVLCANKSSCPAPIPIHNDEEDGHKHRVWEYVKAELQPSCSLICLRGFGMIGTSSDLSETVELENSRAYSLLLLPEMPGVTIHTFFLDKNQVSKLDKTQPHNIDSNVLEELTGIPTGEPVKCLLLFCRESTFFITPVIHLVTALQMRQDETMAVAGGVFGDIGGIKGKIPFMVGVAFTGDGVSVASTVLDRSLKSERDADRVMQELKAHTVMNYNSSIGLMFACVGRGKHHYHGKRNVESAAFRKYFPKTPLFGYFGNGEIGFKLLPDIADNKKQTPGPTKENKRRRTDIPDILHSYTTIMVHLAFTNSNNGSTTHR